MTRKEKYAQLRASVELDNLNHMFVDFYDYQYIITHQREIKDIIGAKH